MCVCASAMSEMMEIDTCESSSGSVSSRGRLQQKKKLDEDYQQYETTRPRKKTRLPTPSLTLTLTDSDDEEEENESIATAAAASSSSSAAAASSSSSSSSSSSTPSSTPPSTPRKHRSSAPAFTPSTEHDEEWMNDAEDVTRQFDSQQLSSGKESKGYTWSADMGELTEKASGLYNSRTFIEDNWSLFSTRPLPSADELTLLRSTANNPDNDLTEKEKQLFAMMSDPQNARHCTVPFFVVRNAVTTTVSYSYISPVAGARPMTTIHVGATAHQVSTASVLYRVAYPDSVFTKGDELSHLQSNLGSLGRFCVAPRFVTLESPSKNLLRNTCAIRWRDQVDELKKKHIEMGVEVSPASLMLCATHIAHQFICTHRPPLCVFDCQIQHAKQKELFNKAIASQHATPEQLHLLKSERTKRANATRASRGDYKYPYEELEGGMQRLKCPESGCNSSWEGEDKSRLGDNLRHHNKQHHTPANMEPKEDEDYQATGEMKKGRSTYKCMHCDDSEPAVKRDVIRHIISKHKKSINANK